MRHAFRPAALAPRTAAGWFGSGGRASGASQGSTESHQLFSSTVASAGVPVAPRDPVRFATPHAMAIRFWQAVQRAPPDLVPRFSTDSENSIFPVAVAV